MENVTIPTDCICSMPVVVTSPNKSRMPRQLSRDTKCRAQILIIKQEYSHRRNESQSCSETFLPPNTNSLANNVKNSLSRSKCPFYRETKVEKAKNHRHPKQLPEVDIDQEVRIAPVRKKQVTCVVKLLDRSNVVQSGNKTIRRKRQFPRPRTLNSSKAEHQCWQSGDSQSNWVVCLAFKPQTGFQRQNC